MSNILLRCQDLVKIYQEGAVETPVLKGISDGLSKRDAGDCG